MSGYLHGWTCKVIWVGYLAALTIDDPYVWPLQVGSAKGLMAANGEGTIPLIPESEMIETLRVRRTEEFRRTIEQTL